MVIYVHDPFKISLPALIAMARARVKAPDGL
jgi:hypothetical protein